MQIVTDGGIDLPQQLLDELNIHFVPLNIQLSGKSYQSGIDLTPPEFYRMLMATQDMPTTSTPSAGEFAELYRKLAKDDPEILSIHISSGLSGTFNVAQQAAEMVPEARITFFDTKTLSAAQNWQVETAARMAKLGVDLEKIMAWLKQIQQKTRTFYTLPDLKYLIHGGRINHIKGLLASALRITPLIEVSREDGKYYEIGKKRTFRRAVEEIVNKMEKVHPFGSSLRVQIAHAENPEGEEMLIALINERYDCEWIASGSIAPALGAHTGPGLVGAAFSLLSDFPVFAQEIKMPFNYTTVQVT